MMLGILEKAISKEHHPHRRHTPSSPNKIAASMSINISTPPRFNIPSSHTYIFNKDRYHPPSPPAPIFLQTLQKLQQLGLWGEPPLYQNQPKEVTITRRFLNITTITKNTIIIIYKIYNISSDIQKKIIFQFFYFSIEEQFSTICQFT